MTGRLSGEMTMVVGCLLLRCSRASVLLLDLSGWMPSRCQARNCMNQARAIGHRLITFWMSRASDRGVYMWQKHVLEHSQNMKTLDGTPDLVFANLSRNHYAMCEVAISLRPSNKVNEHRVASTLAIEPARCLRERRIDSSSEDMPVRSPTRRYLSAWQCRPLLASSDASGNSHDSKVCLPRVKRLAATCNRTRVRWK